MAARKPVFNQQVLYDTTPLPDSIPSVKECKTDNPGKGEFECLKEGRRVTRCAASVIEGINKSCLEEFRKHWQCLDNNNHQLWQCRKDEWKLNKCVYNNLKLEKEIPDAQGIPVHLRTKQIYAHYPIMRDVGQPTLGKSVDPPSAQKPDAPAS